MKEAIEQEVLTPEQMRDRIRAVTVGAAKDFKSEDVLFQGVKIEFREPTERQRAAIFDRAKKKVNKEETDVDTAELTTWSLICCAFVPGTNMSVFTEADYESLMEMPASQLDTIKTVALKYLNVDREKMAKNSLKTTEDSTASNSQTN